MALDEFLASLRMTVGDPELADFCRKRVLHGTPHVFQGKEDEYYEFRKRIASKFGVSFHEIFVTGSAKLGFSPYKGTAFSLESDVDVAIVSVVLFDEFLERTRGYQMALRTARRRVGGDELALYHQFLEYVAMGWIRPDKMPLSFRVRELKQDWFDFFNSISYGRSQVGNYKVSGGVFRTYRHLELYTLSGVAELRASLTL